MRDMAPDDQVARAWPALLAGVAALMFVVGLLSCVGPALRGLRIQPTRSAEAARVEGSLPLTSCTSIAFMFVIERA
jgi:predicted lysophospholipase L1 biosynthesis ABC-type transport system permease subunit